MNRVVTEPEAPTSTDRQRGVDRVIDILEELLRHRKAIRVGDLARRLSAPRSTLYTLVNRLVEAELLEASDVDGAVFFGRAMHLYGTAYADANPLQRRARELLVELAGRTEATAQFCARRGAKYVVLDSQSGRGPFRITGDVGVPVPLPWTASGRLLLEQLSPAQIQALIPAEDYRLPDGRTIDPEAFLADVARAREAGFCITTGLSDHFACCLAAPVRSGPAGRTVATLCFVTSAEATDQQRRDLMALLLDAAADLSL